MLHASDKDFSEEFNKQQTKNCILLRLKQKDKDQKINVIWLKINIGTYVKGIKKNSENLDLISWIVCSARFRRRDTLSDSTCDATIKPTSSRLKERWKGVFNN
jgi:hypothetical protein